MEARRARQVTAMRAPPSPERPIDHDPPVLRTTASAIASPSPVPPGRSSARWNRSRTSSRSASGIPGPESSTASVTWPPASVTPQLDPAAAAGVPAGVVQQHADQPVDRVAVRPDGGTRSFEVMPEGHRRGACHRREALDTGHSERGHVDSRLGRVIAAIASARASQRRSSTIERSRPLSEEIRRRVAW